MERMTDHVHVLTSLLAVDDSSARLQAALAAGTHPEAEFLDPLLERCAIEPDFYVRDMLTWALTRLPLEQVLPRVIQETRAEAPQARSQALHTLSKLADPRGFEAVGVEHLHDPDDEVARAAWRTAAGLVPYDQRDELARELCSELGRGDLAVMRSLSRAFVDLGDAAPRALHAAALGDEGAAAQHASATLRLIEDPEASFVLD